LTEKQEVILNMCKNYFRENSKIHTGRNN